MLFGSLATFRQLPPLFIMPINKIPHSSSVSSDLRPSLPSPRPARRGCVPALLALVLTLLQGATAAAAEGDFDTGFGTGGRVSTDIAASSNYLESGLRLSDGKLLVVGSTGSPPNQDVALVRYTKQGALDPSFGTNGVVVTDIANAYDSGLGAVEVANGKVVVLCSSTANYGSCLIRYHRNGDLDATFGNGGIALLPPPTHYSFEAGRAIALQGDGKIVTVGTTAGEVGNRVIVRRFSAAGVPDASFGDNGAAIVNASSLESIGADIKLQENGRIVVAAMSVLNYDSPFGSATFEPALFRLTTNGSVDSSFADGLLTLPSLSAVSQQMAPKLAQQADGRIVLAVTAMTVGANYLVTTKIVVVRLHTNGKPDHSFGVSGMASPFAAERDAFNAGVAVDDEQNIVLAATAAAPSGLDLDVAVTRLNSRGTVDPSFNGGATRFLGADSQYTNAVNLLLQPDCKIVVLGRTFNGADHDFAAFRLLGKSTARCH